jgi:hypothetical protein
MPNAAPLVNRTDSVTRQWDSPLSTYRRRLVQFADLEAERDALREMVRRAKATEMFFQKEVQRLVGRSALPLLLEE